MTLMGWPEDDTAGFDKYFAHLFMTSPLAISKRKTSEKKEYESKTRRGRKREIEREDSGEEEHAHAHTHAHLIIPILSLKFCRRHG